MHIIITHVYVWSKQVVFLRKMALFIISQDRQTQGLAAVAMATTIIMDKNSWFPWSFSPAKCSTAFACNNLSDCITTKNKTKSYTLTWRIWTFCPQASFPRARLTRPIHLFRHQPAICRQWLKLRNWVATPQFLHYIIGIVLHESSRNVN